MSSVALVILTLSVTCTSSDQRCSRQDGGCGYRGVGIRPIREGSRIEILWSHSIHITPDSAAIEMKIWAGKREETVLKTRL